MQKLTLKQKKFIDAYIALGNATQAAIQAGYSKKTAGVIGVENLGKPNIKAAIDKRLKQLEDKAIAKQEEVLRYLTAVLRGESSSEVIVTEGVGEGRTEAKRIQKAPDEKERLKAAELLGKRYALFTDRQETAVDMDLKIEVDYGEDSRTDESGIS